MISMASLSFIPGVVSVLGLASLAMNAGTATPAPSPPVQPQAIARPAAGWADAAARARDYTVAVAVRTGEGTQVGTGVVVDGQGRTITSRHLVAGSATAEVALPDGRIVAGRVAARSEEHDLAVLQLPAGPYTAAVFGAAAALRVGDEVLAAGFPPGFSFEAGPTVTRGIVSKPAGRYLQTDAPINPGMSGGPIVDRDGRVVGIIESRYDVLEGRRIQGIGFAIPSETVRLALDTLNR